MKKFILAAVAVIASLTASAQVYVGGQIGYTRDFDENKTEFAILPEVGYKFNDSWAAGMVFGYDHIYNNGLSGNMGVINPYARWTYYSSSNNLVNLFLDGGVGIDLGSSKYKDSDSSDTAVAWNIGIKPGIAINPTEHFSILAHIGMLGYEGANDEAKAIGYTSKFGFNFKTTSLNLGFVYNF